MKKRIIIIVVVCAVAAGVLFGFQIPQRIGFAAEAAHYLAEKYGENYHVVDCVYSRMGYTDSHYDILGNGSTTDYPDLAIFGRGESSIAVHRRLRKRGTETEEKIIERTAQAREELKFAENYDYLIVNGELSVAVDDLKAVITAEKLRKSRCESKLAELRAE